MPDPTLIPKDTKDVCEVCGCTDEQSCPGGCEWDRRLLDEGRTVCTRCTDEEPEPAIILRGDPRWVGGV